MKKIIFLDIDWVLNLDYDTENKKNNEKWYWDSCNNLVYILKKTDARIVISSSWRHNLWDLYRVWQKNWLNWDYIIWVTPSRTNKWRDEEIRQWINWNKYHLYPYKYVIIDDRPEILPINHMAWNLIIPDVEKWITRPCAEAVIKQLNS